jgi:acetolactate synthase I/II/III large subunit
MLSLVKVDVDAHRLQIEASSVADQLVTRLAQLGIREYFGVPGGAIEPLFNALARQQARGAIGLTPMRSEAGAAFAADGFCRATGRMAVCTATTGPGTTNLITAVMSAHADRVPMLVLTPQVAAAKQGRGALQDSTSDGYDLERMLAECCRYSSVVTHPEQLPHKLARALDAAWGAPSGPVHLSFASDLLAQQHRLPSLAPLRVRSSGTLVDEPALGAMVHELRGARSPLFYIGDDAGPGAERAVATAARVGASVVTSPAGKRWVGHTDPVFRGVLGFSGHPAAARAVAEADLVLAFGATFDELSTNAWSCLPARIPLFSIDTHRLHAYRQAHARPVIAPVARVLDEIEAHCPARTLPARASVRAPATPLGSEEGRVHPADLMGWLGQKLPRHVVVHVDAGNSFSWSTRYLERVRPDTYRVAMGAASMGWAIGAVVGAAIGTGQRTICVVGDGSMLMSGLELTVAVERRLPITYVVLNDSSLGMVRHGQRLASAESIAHEIAPVRFDKLAKACGARGRRIRSLQELERVQASWLSDDRGGPALIDVQIDPEAVPPMADRVLGLAMGVPK